MTFEEALRQVAINNGYVRGYAEMENDLIHTLPAGYVKFNQAFEEAAELYAKSEYNKALEDVKKQFTNPYWIEELEKLKK